MLTVTGTIKIENKEEVDRIIGTLQRRAERSRKDAGCLDYVFSISVEDPTELRVFEKWESEELLNAHLQIPDEEFNEFLQTAKIVSAVVLVSEISSEREMLRREP